MMLSQIRSISRLKLLSYKILTSYEFQRPLSGIQSSLLVSKIKEKPSLQWFPQVEVRRSFWETFPSFSFGSLYEKDGLDRKNHEIVYKSTTFSYLFYSQLVSMTVFTIQVYYTAFFIYALWFAIPFDLPKAVGPFPITYNFGSYIVLAIFTAQNLFVYTLARRGVLRIYYNHENNEYVFIRLHANPFMTTKLYCKPGELEEIPKPRIPFLLGRFKIRNNRIVINPTLFKSMEHFNRLLGHIP